MKQAEFLQRLDAALQIRVNRKMARQRIERAYQRAMDIRDSYPAREWSQALDDNESRYLRQYMRAYRAGNAEGFSAMTRQYLKTLTSFPEQRVKEGL